MYSPGKFRHMGWNFFIQHSINNRQMKNRTNYQVCIDNDKIRYAIKHEEDFNEELNEYQTCSFYHFQVFRRPYFFGLIGIKRWCNAGNWVTYQYGYNWCLKVLSREIYKKPL